MATHQDLLEAINRVRAATGNRDAWQNGLTGEDIAAACNPFTSSAALGAVLTRIVAAHPEAFLPGAAATAPPANQGRAAEAIRDAESALAHQSSTAAQVDLQVVTAVLNAHAANVAGAAELNRLQREIEAAVLSRTDLDTPAGAREFQRFLIGKLREIRTVVDTAGLDATSKAALAAALASLYASATPEAGASEDPARKPEPEGPQERSAVADRPARPDSSASGELADLSEFVGGPDVGAVRGFAAGPDFADSPWDISEAPLDVPPEPIYPIPPMTPAMGGPAMAPSAPAWGAGPPFGGVPPAFPDPGQSGLGQSGLGQSVLGRPDLGQSGWGQSGWGRDLGLSSGISDLLRDRDTDLPPEAESAAQRDPGASPEADADEEPDDTGGDDARDPADEADTGAGGQDEAATPGVHTVQLPDGQTIIAPTPVIAATITAAVAGTPIPEAFRQQGINIPPPGSPVTVPIDGSALQIGDIGVFADRHALALGNGTALLDHQIQPVANVTGPGFLGWQHPPAPTIVNPPPPAFPAPTRPAETAPS